MHRFLDVQIDTTLHRSEFRASSGFPVHALRFNRTLLNRFLRLIGDAPTIRGQIQSLFITTAGQKTVNQGHIGGLLIPLPPLAEQHRIVAKVDELMTLVDRLKADLAESRARHARLSASLIEFALEAA